MDKRDSYNSMHMHKRIDLASHCSLQRQLKCAEHLLRIAIIQDRMQLEMLALIWKHKLEEKLKDENRKC